jgi:hypothetical protein
MMLEFETTKDPNAVENIFSGWLFKIYKKIKFYEIS